jgi:hypothetical protein
MNLKKWLKKETWYNNLIWIFIILSVIFISVGYYCNNEAEIYDDVIRNIGYSILGSGVFASVLKSLQFTKLFKEEIREVITGDDFIENRKDLPNLWKKITQKMYNEKFPEVSVHLEDMIMEHYVPAKQNHYYKDYSVTVDIKSLSKDMVIEYTQTNEFTVILAENVNETTVTIGSNIIAEEDNGIKNDITCCLINNQQADIKEEDATIGDDLMKDYKLHLNSGERRYDIKIIYDRKYSLRSENYKKFVVKSYLKRMDVVINHPEDVAVSFFSIGCVTKFKKRRIDLKNQIHRLHDQGLIMPDQGFGMSFEKL